MASAYPVAIGILIAFFGAVLLPVLWWCLAYWQRKRKLLFLSKLSMFFSVIPILSVFGLMYGTEISAKYSVIFFFTTPYLSCIIFLAIFALTMFRVRSQNDL